MIAKKSEDEVVEEDFRENEEMKIEKEDSGNKGDQEERGATIDQLIDKNSPWRRTKKHILNDSNPNLPDYLKTLYPIIKKKSVHEDEA